MDADDVTTDPAAVRAALADPQATLAKVRADALREAADELEGLGYAYPRHWLRERADALDPDGA